MVATNLPKLDAREEHFRIPSYHSDLALFLRYLPPVRGTEARGNVVLYVHGGTFPSGLSIAHRFDGRSWRDELAASGFHCWGLDFHGFGRFSDPYPEMAEPPENHAPLGRAEDASRQLEQAVHFICAHHRVPRISLIAHSWGSIVAGRFAGRCPDLVDRLGLLRADRVAGAARRSAALAGMAGYFAARTSGTASLPTCHQASTPVLAKRHFDEWGEAYLDIDASSRTRTPPSVKTPSGAFQDIYDAWAGKLAYDPASVRAPVAIIRGEWDGMCSAEDAQWLFDALKGVAGPAARHHQPRHPPDAPGGKPLRALS